MNTFMIKKLLEESVNPHSIPIQLSTPQRAPSTTLLTPDLDGQCEVKIVYIHINGLKSMFARAFCWPLMSTFEVLSQKNQIKFP